jgi:hypothetical protein
VDRGRFLVAVIVAGALWAVPSASADIIAAVDVPVAAGPATAINEHPDQFDIALLNATTGAKLSLPAGVNTTTADEFHPSITPDGRWLAFERVDPSAGTTRIIAANLSTGQQADLFTAFDTPTFQPTTPFVEPDGGSVLTGTPYTSAPRWTQTPLGNFPSPPFGHTQVPFPIGAPAGQTLDPVDRSFAAGVTVLESNRTEDVLLTGQFSSGRSSVTVSNSADPSATVGFAHPTISDQTTDVAVMERRRHGSCVAINQCTVIATLGYLPDVGAVFANPTNLPALVNATGADEAFPAFTPDGRYLGFVRQLSNGDDRLFVFDTVTQTLLNSSGIDLGVVGAPSSPRDELRRMEGNLSLRQTPVLTPLFLVAPTGLVSFQLATSSGVGLLVQRIVGHHKLFGRRVPTLKTIGRVPLGHFRRGKHTLHWNLRVEGRRLKPGRYLVTPRSVTSRLIVTGLGTPRILTIR